VNNRVKTIGVDSSNNLWLGTEFGISKFDGNHWTSYIQTDNSLNYILSIACQSTNIWFGTLAGVEKFDNTSWNTYNYENGLAHNQVYAIATDLEGNIWFGTQLGASKFDGTTWKNYTKDDGLAENWVTSIVVDKQGDIWFGTLSGGLSKLHYTSR